MRSVQDLAHRPSFGNGWEGPDYPSLMTEGETILWQGRPVQSIRWEYKSIRFAAIGCAVVFLLGMPNYLNDGRWTDLALITAFWAVVFIVSYHGWAYWTRRRTSYALSAKRAFIATNKFGISDIRSIDLAASGELRLVGEGPGSVYFAKEWVKKLVVLYSSQDERILVKRDVGFIDVANPKEVYDLIQKLRNAPR